MKQLDPKAVWLFFFINLSGGSLVLFFLGIPLAMTFMSVGTRDSGIVNIAGAIPYLLLGGGMYIGACYFWSKLYYKMYKYKLGEDAFQKELGIVYKKYVTIPYSRVQNVDIHRGIIARILGLSSINIQTAGASGVQRGYGGEGQLMGVSQETAEMIRDELIKKISPAKEQGL